MSRDIFSDHFKPTPYWWERTPRPVGDDVGLSPSADVVVIGSGYTGLCAAIQTAGHGRHTIVVDAGHAGWGCSTRNGGQVSTSIKPTYDLLSRKYGSKTAIEILQEGNRALDWVESFIAENSIHCNFRRCGRFHAAHTPASFDQLKRKVAAIPAALEANVRMVEPEEQETEIRSPVYHGGAVFPRHASLDPGRYHQGLYQCAKSQGVEIVSHCRVNAIEKTRNGLDVLTSKGKTAAENVIVATNGYTGSPTPWQQHRIIPIGSYVIATEPLDDGLPEQLIANDRVISDTRKLVVYYRTCPQRKRIIFGGRVSLKETDPEISAPKLRELMVQCFPELESVRISHSWMGFVGYTFDEMPHLGKHDGIHYSLGYCGSGISLASYLGMKTGLKVAGSPAGETPFDKLMFPGRFYYRGNPWFLAPSIFYYRWRDRRNTG